MIFFFFCYSSTAQQTVTYQQISQEAYLDYLDKGYPANMWPMYQAQYVEEYKKKNYTATYGGSEYQRKVTLAPGVMTNFAGQTIGSYSNGQVLNSGYQPVGYIQNGYFMSRNGLNSACVGYVRGSNIMNCQGGVYYTVNGSTITNFSGYVVAYIRGESLYNTSNQLLVTISGININSIAAYLLFLAR